MTIEKTMNKVFSHVKDCLSELNISCEYTILDFVILVSCKSVKDRDALIDVIIPAWGDLISWNSIGRTKIVFFHNDELR